MSDEENAVSLFVYTDHESLRRQTSAFRYILSFQYLTEFFYFNENATDSTNFLYNEIPVSNFKPTSTIDNTIGTVLFDRNELEASTLIEATVKLILRNGVRSGERYEINFEAEWNSLPYGYVGGRSYNSIGKITIYIPVGYIREIAYSHSGTITAPINDTDISLSYFTSNPLTPDLDLQVQEVISINVTIFFPEVRTRNLCQYFFIFLQYNIGNF